MFWPEIIHTHNPGKGFRPHSPQTTREKISGRHGSWIYTRIKLNTSCDANAWQPTHWDVGVRPRGVVGSSVSTQRPQRAAPGGGGHKPNQTENVGGERNATRSCFLRKNEPQGGKGGGAVVRWTGMVADEKGGARTDFIADSCCKKTTTTTQ